MGLLPCCVFIRAHEIYATVGFALLEPRYMFLLGVV